MFNKFSNYLLKTGSLFFILFFFMPVLLTAEICTAPDNGSGTVDLPANCNYIAPGDPFNIINGLPPGTTIELDPTITDYSAIYVAPGGNLGGGITYFNANLELNITGTGALTGFNRFIIMPVICELHAGPRTPGDPVQLFQTDIVQLQGTIFGDPDFDVLEIRFGVNFGLLSPGETTLSDLGDGNFNVESFFDIIYEIDFAGSPGSILSGLMGTTPDKLHLHQGEQFIGGDHWEPDDGHIMHAPQFPDETGWDVNATYPIKLGDDWLASTTEYVKDIHFWGSWKNGYTGYVTSFNIKIYNDVPAGTDLPYSHPGEMLWENDISEYNLLEINPGSTEGWYDSYLGSFQENDHNQYFQYDIYLPEDKWFSQEFGHTYWLVISANLDPLFEDSKWGWKSSINHWNDDAVWGISDPPVCTEPDNGSGTIDLPGSCPYILGDGETMEIIEGFPAGTIIDIDASITDFINVNITPGGDLGGEIIEFEATMQMPMTGTGALTGFVRTLFMPITMVYHTAPRTPGDPIQIFATDLKQISGSVFGDPDFSLLGLNGGTDYGLPSLGQITLISLPDGNWQFDSFFDISYEIHYEGAPGSILDGMMGSTTQTSRFLQNETSGIKSIEAACVAPDNGTGTINIPADCEYTSDSADPLAIIDGLPPGTEILIDAVMTDYSGLNSNPGGSLGGEQHFFNANIYMTMTGTGSLTGLTRNIIVPVSCEMHSGPRNPGDPIQNFPIDLYQMSGGINGDPDFLDLFIGAGTGFGLPCPGDATATDLGDGTFYVESFFDITYIIDFTGAPGSILQDLSGTTQGSSRMDQGEPSPAEWTELFEPPSFIESLDLSFVITGGVTDGCCDLPGDANNDGTVGISDLTYFVDYMFVPGSPGPICYEEFDNNGDCTLGISDLTYFVDYMFTPGATPPVPCHVCPK